MARENKIPIPDWVKDIDMSKIGKDSDKRNKIDSEEENRLYIHDDDRPPKRKETIEMKKEEK